MKNERKRGYPKNNISPLLNDQPVEKSSISAAEYRWVSKIVGGMEIGGEVGGGQVGGIE